MVASFRLTSSFTEHSQDTRYDARNLPRAKRRGAQHSARIRYDDGDEVDLPEDRYRAQGYDPPFDKLPWKDVGQIMRSDL